MREDELVEVEIRDDSYMLVERHPGKPDKLQAELLVSSVQAFVY